MVYFDAPIRAQAADAREVILHLLRNHPPSHGRPSDLVDLTERYLRLNPDDTEVSPGRAGIPRPEHVIPRSDQRLPSAAQNGGVRRCAHPTPTLRAAGGATRRFAVRCPVCGTAGPPRPTPEAARKALSVLGMRYLWANPFGPTPRCLR